MTALGLVRRSVVAACLLGVAGMIAASVTGHLAVVITFGLVTTAGVLCLMVATVVAEAAQAAPDRAAADLEDAVQALVAAGADEDQVRRLARLAVELGRSLG
ncbi:MAG TPA: hypothetical protein VKY15_07030 [Acidimicrobiales bacterium]|nr:hypothetical protein [Acidimicrobiales bacterium]